MADEKVLEKLVEIVPEWLRPYAIGLLVTYAVAYVCKEIIPLVPKTRKTRRRRAIEAYLAQPAELHSVGSDKEKSSSHVDAKIRDHFRLLRDSDVFFQATGIRCKAQTRRLWIDLYERTGDDWTWDKLASASPYFKGDSGELKYHPRNSSHLFDIIFNVVLMSSIGGMTAVAFNFEALKQNKNFIGIVAVLSVLAGVFCTSLIGTLPYYRAHRLKKAFQIPTYRSPRATVRKKKQ